MRAIKSLLMMTAVVGLVTMMGVRSFADILPPFPTTWIPGQEVKGEVTVGVTHDANDKIDPQPLKIDWIVKAFDIDGDNVVDIWGYFYQIENNSLATVSSLSIATPYHPFFYAGFSNIDIDEDFSAPPPGSGTVSGHSISGELEGGEIQNADGYYLDNDGVTWYFYSPKLTDGYESGLLFAYANIKPTYGGCSVNDNNINWGVGYGIPIPSPEPSSMALMVLGILGGVFMRRRLIA